MTAYQSSEHRHPRAENAATGDPMAKGQAKKEKKNKPKLTVKEKQAKKAAKRAAKDKK